MGTGVVVMKGLRVGTIAPGVKIRSIHMGGVRIAASTGSIKPTGRLVRKSLFGSMFDPIVASNSQLGERRTDIHPARSRHRNPMRMMAMMMTQSRLSCLVVFIGFAVNGQSHKDRCAGIGGFVKAGAFQPDAAAMCIDNTAGDGQPKSGATTSELGFAGGM